MEKMTDVEVMARRKKAHMRVEPLLLNITQVAHTLCLSRTKVYQLIACEGLPTVRFGKSVRVSVSSLQGWVEQREKGV